MNSDELEAVLSDCPTLYHMAEHNSWGSIKGRGLLSTSAILDVCGIDGDERVKIEKLRRPTSVTVETDDGVSITIRDQIPMTDGALEKCLLDDLTPQDWYQMLNQRVFFWLSEKRLLRLLGARAYRDKMHDILELDARALVRDYSKKITLSPINSGSTIFNPQPRGKETFSRITDYPYEKWKARRGRKDRVVELAVDYSVPNVSDYVRRVVQMQGNKEIKVLKI